MVDEAKIEIAAKTTWDADLDKYGVTKPDKQWDALAPGIRDGWIRITRAAVEAYLKTEPRP